MPRKTPSPSPRDNPVHDLLRVLDRELTVSDLDALPSSQLRQLRDLFTHWSSISGFRLDRRLTKELLAETPPALLRRQAG
jgi:hypothetical protein